MTRTIAAAFLVLVVACEAEPDNPVGGGPPGGGAAPPDGGGGSGGATADYGDELARASAVYAACIGTDLFGASGFLSGQIRLGLFSQLAPAGLREYVRCLASVEDGCAEASACGIAVTPADSCDVFCEGDTLIACRDDFDNFTIAVDCQRFGGVCDGLGCRIPGTPLCDDPGLQSCNGDTATHCNWTGESYGYLLTEDCAATGQVCIMEWDNAVCSYPAGTSCTDHVCDDDGIVYCFYGELDRYHRCPGELECRLRPPPTTSTGGGGEGGEGGEGGADPNASLSYAYCGLDEACDNLGLPTCRGTELSACILGRPATIDCTSLGFSSCTPGVGCAP